MRSDRFNWLTVAQAYTLDIACQPLADAWEDVYQVGSSLMRPDYRDVDVRIMLPGEQFNAMFCAPGSRKLIDVALSEWLSARTGLPIDCQFQSIAEANEKFKGPRSALGMRGAR